MNTKEPMILDARASIQNFLTQTRQKIENGTYVSKEELQREIINYNESLGVENKDYPLNLQSYPLEIQNLLATFDKINQQRPDYSRISEVQTENGKTIVNLNDSKGNNIALRQETERPIVDELNDLYNKNAAHLDTITPDTVPDNYRLLQEKVKVEVPYDKNISQPKNIIEPPQTTIEALTRFALENNVPMEFTFDGYGIDAEGNQYEAVIEKDGSIRIQKMAQNKYDPTNKPAHVPAETLKVIPPSEQILTDSTIPSMPGDYVTYLKSQSLSEDGSYNQNYIKILASSTLPTDIQVMYANRVEESIASEKERKETEMKTNENYQPNEMPKTKVYRNEVEGRGGFVNAFLLSIITILFGALCTAYIFFGIFG